MSAICQPLRCIEQLLNWHASQVAETLCSQVPLSDYAIARALEPRQRVLACHDFKGGYLDYEKYPDGITGQTAELMMNRREAFIFRHWGFVDIFVYFSHHRVTIPPVCWIESGHRHGALVLGTFIFEWEGAARELILAVMEEERRKMVAEQLVRIAKRFGFEGWLFNFEVYLPSRQYVGLIGDLLKQTCDRMKEEIGPHAMVLWYDAVTVQGRLRWQNRLNEQNYYYFERCDGIFTNYHWQPNDVYSSQLASNGRQWDVFTGIDVFGRGTFGGGGYQSYIAAQVAKQMGTSVALFAFGWTVEEASDNSNVEESQSRFWESNTHSMKSVFPPRVLWSELPLETFWETGYGRCSFVQGKQVAYKPYVHIRKQQLQPSYTRAHPYLCSDIMQVSTDFNCSWNSSCSLLFRWKRKGQQPQWSSHIIAEADIWITKDVFHLRYWLRISPEQATLFTIGFVTSKQGENTEEWIAIPGNMRYPNTLSDRFRMIPCAVTQKLFKENDHLSWLETSIQFLKEEWEKHFNNTCISKVIFLIMSDRVLEEKNTEHTLSCHLGGIQMQQYNRVIGDESR